MIEVIAGAEGVAGWAFTVTVDAAFVVHVLSLVLRTVKVYVPEASPLKVAED